MRWLEGLLVAAAVAGCSSPAQPVDAGPGDAGFPPLGVYVVGVDGTGFRQLVDPGTQALTHVRRRAGSDWLTATRYTDDLDRNGLAMELEAGQAYYQGAEVVVFALGAPGVITRVAGGVPGKLCANSSWTDDGQVIFVQQDHPGDPGLTRLKRARFSTLPTVAQVETIPTPPELLLPVDPHQVGPSTDGGTIVFPATFQHPSGWMRPVWRMSAAGAATIAEVALVGCPICPANNGCCAFATLGEVLGANDPRLSHAGTEVIWMQQSPQVSFGAPPLYPYRQVRKVGAAPQEDLVPPDPTGPASQTFIEWRSDDQQGVYWAIELEGSVLRHNLYVMRPDGTGRQKLSLPRELCPSHPSYLSDTEIVFSAFRCAGPTCTCDATKL